jgi:hypothetical protein
MKCPHCLENFHGNTTTQCEEQDKEHAFILKTAECPACGRLIVVFVRTKTLRGEGVVPRYEVVEIPVHPRTPARKAIPADVPTSYVDEYREALVVLPDSAKASAALSRRLLQRLLREVARVKPDDLSKEIDEILSSGRLPGDTAQLIDIVRQVGNFATHPIKNKTTGEITEVEPGEAELLLDVIEDLFDVLFVRPAIADKRRKAIDEKLRAVGKPALKAPPEAPKSGRDS